MTRNLNKLLSMVAMAGLLGGAGCLGSTPTGTTSGNPTSTDPSTASPAAAAAVAAAATPTNTSPTDPANTSSGSTSNTFDHTEDNTVDPFQVLSRIEQQGPPEISTRMHDCGKMKYVTVGNLLSDFGIDPTTGGATTPGGLYKSGAGALGQANYANRLAESTILSTAGAVRLYDIFVAAAPTIITNMPTMTRCMVAGVATNMFDATGSTCTMAGITCLTGAPATQSQQDLCNSAVASNTTDLVGMGTGAPTVGQVVAISSLLASAHSCE